MSEQRSTGLRPPAIRILGSVHPGVGWSLLALITAEVALSLVSGLQWASGLVASIGILAYAVGFAMHYNAGHACGAGWFLRKRHIR